MQRWLWTLSRKVNDMEKFFEDKRDIDEVNASYVGKNMLEIM